MTKRDTLILVDGSSFLFRAYHALPSLSSPRGEPTGAVYGIVNMLRKLLDDYRPDRIAVVFDARGKNFRHELYPEYKANRPPMPEELRTQLERVKEIVAAMGLPVLSVPGVEADDVIATLASRAGEKGYDTLIVSGDKDLAQLVNGEVEMVDTMSGVRYDPEGVLKKFGVPPERIVDYLALVGDVSDNIPGVPKVGPKTAAKWLAKYGSLDEIIAHAGEIGGKVGESLREHLDQLPLARELATVRRDIELDPAPEDLAPGAPDAERLREIFTELAFRSWLDDLAPALSAPEKETGSGQNRRDGYETLLDEPALKRWLEKMASAELVAVDTETTAIDPQRAELVGLSFAVTPGAAAYLPLAHRYPGAPPQLPLEETLEKLRPLLEGGTPPKVGQNLKYDIEVLANAGIALGGVAFDTMLESYLLDAGNTRHDMDTLALKHLGHRTITYKEVAGSGRKQLTFDQVDLEHAAPYAAEDADVTLRLHRALYPRLAAEPRLKQLFEEIEMPLVPVLARVEANGVRIDTEMLRRQSGELARAIAEIEKRAHLLAGEPFNIASPKQIQEILYGKLGLPVLRKTPKGAPSTAEGVLEELAVEYELPRLILEHRGLAKLKSTYTDKLPELVNPRTGRLHTSYHQAVAATGRLSSSDPNLQNIPVRTAEGRRIREAFITDPGNLLISADYSQVELRIMAHLSGDEGLLAAFAAGQDIHRATAAEVFGVTPEAVTDEQRRHAKAINFGLIYGMSAFGLARQLRIDRGAAQSYIDRYFERYPGVLRYMEETKEKAREQGYVETLFGRRLYLPEINSRNGARRQYAERTAINAPMQGTAADLIKLSMLAVDRWIREQHPAVRMILQVHDELVLEAPEEEASTLADEAAELMSGVAELRAPLVVDTGIGRNWAEAH